MKLDMMIEEAAKRELLSGLRALGLSTYEASTFHKLVIHSELTATELCKETGIPDSKIYNTLSELERRGMIAVQRGRPNLFRALRPEEAMANLKRALDEEHKQRLMTLDELTLKLSALYESIENRGEVELAYIIRGIRGIYGKMNDLINSAKRSLLLFIPDTKIWREVEEAIAEAVDHGIKIDVALTDDVDRTSLVERLREVKSLDCECCLLVVDGRTLLNVPDWSPDRATAILTQERNMIRFTREYYNNPKCCSNTMLKAE